MFEKTHRNDEFLNQSDCNLKQNDYICTQKHYKQNHKNMAQVSMTVRMDAQLKKNFDELCQQFGMSANTAMNIFANAVVVYRKIPFEIKAAEKEETLERGRRAFYALREQARENGLQEMTLDEINEEIRQTRAERAKQK